MITYPEREAEQLPEQEQMDENELSANIGWKSEDDCCCGMMSQSEQREEKYSLIELKNC